ncbi:MAG: DUF3261 domain-containing protein [Thermodesulfobacteriota bacterium]
MRKLIFLSLILLLASGCGSVPFDSPQLSPLQDEVAAPECINRFQDRVAEKSNLQSTVVFDGWTKTFSALGILSIDRQEQTFELVGMSPMGFKIFELAGNQQEVTHSYIMDQIPKKKLFLQAIAREVRRIYFNLVPDLDTASINTEKQKVVLKSEDNNGTLHFTYGGKDCNLISKRFYDNNGDLLWKVRYFEYRDKDNKSYPGGIILNNHNYGYQLTITLKEIK